MKILLSAYACHPNKGSEPGIGWNWLKEISKYHEVWAFIYAEQGQREAVQEEIQKLPQKSNIHIIPISVPIYFQNQLYRVRYEIWQWRAYKTAQKFLEEVDLIHHVTIAAWWNCGYMWKLSKPFIFGPLSGAQRIPIAGYSFLRTQNVLYEKIRNLIFDFSWKFWIRFKKAIKNSEMVLCSNEETYIEVKKIRGKKNLVLMTDVGVTERIDKIKKKNSNQNQINLLWAGNIIPLKNLHFFLLVLNNLPKTLNWQLRVAGEGKLLNKLKGEVQKLGIDKRISFLGKIDISQMKAEYDQADIFAFTSLREATGTVLLEAMSHGLPIIAFKMNGAKIVLDDNCSILIDAENKDQMVNDFSNAIIRLAKDPELRQKMGAAGRKRVEEHFLWEKRGKMMNEYYKNILKKK